MPHDRLRSAAVALLLAVSLLLAHSAGHGAHRASVPYLYSDNFSTDIARTDSYSHSAFVESVPPVRLFGLLAYGLSPSGSRALGFYGGFEVDGDAYLYYRFPLTSDSGEIHDGQLAFDLLPDQQFLRLSVVVSFEGAPGGFTQALFSPGHYEFTLLPSTPCSAVFVHFLGDGGFLDNLAVSLSVSTDTESASWGRMKRLFR